MIETGAVGWDVFDGNVDVSRFGTNENPSTDKLSRAINYVDVGESQGAVEGGGGRKRSFLQFLSKGTLVAGVKMLKGSPKRAAIFPSQLIKPSIA